MRRSVAVIGLGFGDEGKGHVVDYLCSVSKDPLVVRFSGGHQAAHHVVLEDGRDHIFAHFGSGSFRGAPTYWSQFCPVNPPALLEEYSILRQKDVKPKLWIHPKCPITTPYDIQWNHTRQGIWRDSKGSAWRATTGVGIYATRRREEANLHLLFEDIFYPRALKFKLAQIELFYFDQLGVRGSRGANPHLIDDFLAACEEIVQSEDISMADGEASDYGQRDGVSTIIFEGSQGLLLDQDIGFYPYVTPSSTGTKNILAMGFSPEVWLVTRAYQTRHGNGPMSDIVPHSIKHNPHEMNGDSGPQGEFCRTLLDLDLICYATSKDEYVRTHKSTLIITCLDLVRGEYRLFDGGDIVQCADEDEFISRIQGSTASAHAVYTSHSAHAEGINRWTDWDKVIEAREEKP